MPFRQDDVVSAKASAPLFYASSLSSPTSPPTQPPSVSAHSAQVPEFPLPNSPTIAPSPAYAQTILPPLGNELHSPIPSLASACSPASSTTVDNSPATPSMVIPEPMAEATVSDQPRLFAGMPLSPDESAWWRVEDDVSRRAGENVVTSRTGDADDEGAPVRIGLGGLASPSYESVKLG
ncbi:hypothetical protein A4X13_0g6397 [Tilletia indica]|uniref:Uncharacterized protein n=1 Tax=Tilletia indica TaxID=43049 RepID=A0A177T570_9BASI|nr:hypothetical protein A4X13_0g6397 [Tilletia indica]